MNQANPVAIVENPRKYETDDVEELRRLLQAGHPAQPDPRRPHFYEIDREDETFYIHISPVTGNATLLAKWNRQTGARATAEPSAASTPTCAVA